ncbi:hypothetical protein MWN33_14025 [Starkeya koreensis]|uniref:BioF2-like acetyltransferase domain-containing protein n=1 Tax=Ancylobacter koreensis TaxID=266121 RepID=A0ABT0DPN7_9HYPH|nr:hypothetical protein [Ancylobacter koreensis]MCK0209149.1 hypothetical protein [Ancylobacter koreensis]
MGPRLPVAAPRTRRRMLNTCPFHTEGYVAGLIGVPELSSRGDMVVLRRPIPGTELHDGVGPWPYLWIGGEGDLKVLREEFRHLVTITAVTQPGYVPPSSAGNPALLKMHYVYDPQRPPVALSRRARLRLSRCEERAEFRLVEGKAQRLQMTDIYARLLSRRGLEGSYVDFPRAHFESIAELDCGVFFEVRDAQGIGAMACGVEFRDMLQILHMASTDEGLRWNASYLLMAGLQRYVGQHGLRLLTGGMPDAGTDGLKLFKERWANHAEPVYLLRIVNDAQAYAALCAGRAEDACYFPAYRAPIATGGVPIPKESAA